MTVPVYKVKGERTECTNYVKCGWKIYAGILVDRVRRVTGSLTDDEQGSFRVGMGCVDQIFTLKQKGEKAREKKRVCEFHRFGDFVR